MARHGCLQNKQNDGEQDQCRAGPVDRQHIECKQSEDKTDATDDAGKDQTGVSDFDI